MASDAYKNKIKYKLVTKSYLDGKRRKDVHEDAAAELVPGLLDDAIDGHFLDVEHGEHGRGKDVHDRLCELVSGACTERSTLV